MAALRGGKPVRLALSGGAAAALFRVDSAGAHEAVQVQPRYNSQAIREDAAAHSSVVISGRTGFGSVINGLYVAQAKVTAADLPTYRSTERDEENRNTFLFYHAANSAWAIAYEVGADAIIAYAPGVQTRPHLVATSWVVVGKDGTFVTDHAVRCAPARVAASPFRRRICKGTVIDLDQRLKPTEVVDLCSELANPASRVQQLKLRNSGLDTAAVSAICASLVDSNVLSHLQIRDNALTDDGVASIANALRKNTSIRLLSLRGDGVTDGGVTAIGKALKDNRTLEGLSLRENKITDVGATALVSTLAGCSKTALRGLALYDNAIGKSRRLSRAVSKLKSVAVELAKPRSDAGGAGGSAREGSGPGTPRAAWPASPSPERPRIGSTAL